MQQSATEVRIEPLEFDSILVRRGLVGLLFAPPHYGILPRVCWPFAEAVSWVAATKAASIAPHVIKTACRRRCQFSAPIRSTR